ncbi:GumC family protein [Sphingomonas sp. URHD0057]|uniref:GumC family protein n=1 Tax=Sphingomonas sp. URHD0057 TaxID=1380389 RepID=UPI000AD0C887|nr:polysaccharide biosynthesis tyrosine autokinase [Sphingomonas sp. URHD0057]
MNTNIAVPNEGPWALGAYDPDAATRLGPGQRSYSASQLLDFATVVRIIYHWRWLVLSAIAVGIVLATLVTLLTTPIYRASVTLEANPPTVAVSEEQTKEREASTVNPYDFVATQVGLLSSKSVSQRTAQDLNLANNPDVVSQSMEASQRLRAATAAVQGGLKVTAPEDGQLIKFSYDSPSPQLAALVANGIADSFINTALQRRYEASAYARNFLERQISKTRSDLERSERALTAYAQAQGIITTSVGPDGKPAGGDAGSLQGESLITLNKALADATARRVAAEGLYRQSLAVGPTSDVTTSTIQLRQQLATLQAEYQQKRTFMKPEHPEMQSLKAQIDELGKQIAGTSAQISSGRNNSLLAEYRGALSGESALQARVNQLKGAVLDLRGRSIQYNILQREVDTNRSLYDALLQRFKEIGVAGGVGMAPVSIVDRADAPTFPFRPNLFMNLLLGLGFGLLAGVGGAVGLEFLNDTIKTREDVRKKLALPCLGAVPRTAAKDVFIEDLKNPTSIVSEAYSAIVAALRFSTESGMPKVLVVTSTRSGEGKSSTALALAQNFARRDKSVLLIDSDLRKPAFKAADDNVGLSKLLTTDDPVTSHVVETQHPGLWLLPSGPVPPNPADLLSTGRIRKIVAEASERFDIVIIDGPPTIGLADAPLLAAAAGNLLFVVESGKTRTRAAIEALNRLEATGTHVLGATLTKSSARGGTYGYGSYGYGYGYGRVGGKRTEILMIPQGSDS